MDLHWEYEPQGFTLDNRKDKHPEKVTNTPQNEDRNRNKEPHNVNILTNLKSLKIAKEIFYVDSHQMLRRLVRKLRF